MNETFATLPSTAGQTVNLFVEHKGKDRVYYYITPHGMSRTFHTKHAAKMYAKRNKWLVCDKTAPVSFEAGDTPENEPEYLAREASL